MLSDDMPQGINSESKKVEPETKPLSMVEIKKLIFESIAKEIKAELAELDRQILYGDGSSAEVNDG